MLSADFKDLIAPKARVLNLIWGALTFAPVMYVVVAWILYGQAANAPDEVVPLTSESGLPLKAVGVGLIPVLGISAIFHQKRSFSGDRLARIMAADPVWPPPGSRLGPDCGPREMEVFERLSETENGWPVCGPTIKPT